MALEDATNPMQGVSGPGKFAKRTDLEYQSTGYGDGVAYDAAKSGAPLERAPKSPMLSQAPVVSGGAGAMTPVTDLFAPDAYPDRDVMYGNKIGPGADASILARAKPVEKISDTLAKMLPFDTTGEITILYEQAVSRGL
jgi:hypothetical protein